MKILLSDFAHQELNEAVYFYDEISASLGDALIEELKDAKKLILAYPYGWAKVGYNQRKYVLKRFPYIILYRVYKDIILISAFAHQHRKPYNYINE
jgi:plasmid stabilization system protein ParE